MRLALLMSLGFLAWVSVTGVLLAGRISATLYIVVLLLGLLAIRQVGEPYVTRELRARVSLFLFAGLLVFAYVAVMRVLDILNS